MFTLLSSPLTQLDTCGQVQDYFQSDPVQCCGNPAKSLPHMLRETYPEKNKDLATVYHYFDTSALTRTEYEALLADSEKLKMDWLEGLGRVK